MNTPSPTSPSFRELPRFFLAILFLALLVVSSLWILSPFLPALIWATLIVVATWPLMLMVQRLLWNKRSLAVLVMTGTLLLIVVGPVVAGVLTVTGHADDVAVRVQALVQAGIPAPPSWVARTPLVGSRVAAEWQALAALGPDELHARLEPLLRTGGAWVLGHAGGLAGLLVHVLLTMVLCALLYGTGEQAAAGVRAFATRLAGVRGDQSVTLAGQSIQAVALGVLVTAFIQAALSGLGMAVAGIPFAGALTVVIFVLGVAQIGAAPILLLALGWLFWTDKTLTAFLFMPWAIFAALLDNFIKPVLIKRGADLPLVLIFAGVIGGLVSFGVVGLFVGPVVLAIAYTQVSAWIADANPATGTLPVEAGLALAGHETAQHLDIQGTHGELARHDG